MKNQLFAFTALASFSATFAMADIVDTKVQDLYAQGYTHFEVARGTVKSQIEAYAPNGTKMIVVLDNQSGASVAEQVYQGSASDFNSAASNIAAIYYEQSDTYQTNGAIPDASTGLSDDGLGYIESSDHNTVAGNSSYESHGSDSNDSYSGGYTESHSSDSNDSYSGGYTESHSSDSNDSYSGGDTESHSSDSNESHGSDDHGDDH